jgi:hypothetical protein
MHNMPAAQIERGSIGAPGAQWGNENGQSVSFVLIVLDRSIGALMTNRKLYAQTLAHLFLTTERKHDRDFAIRYKIGGQWTQISDLLLQHHVRRIAMYLRERAGLAQGECVAVVSTLGFAPFIAELATLVLGAMCVAVDPALPDSMLGDILVRAAPRLAFVDDPRILPRLPDASLDPTGLQEVIVLDGPAASTRATSWEEAMEMGTGLDTPERAESMRLMTRQIAADAGAIADTVLADDGSVSLRVLSHADVLHRLRYFQQTPRAGDVAYIEAGPPSLYSRLALLAFASDGCTAIALGTSGCAKEEIAELHPRYIVPAEPPLDSSVAPTAHDARGVGSETMSLPASKRGSGQVDAPRSRGPLKTTDATTNTGR